MWKSGDGEEGTRCVSYSMVYCTLYGSRGLNRSLEGFEFAILLTPEMELEVDAFCEFWNLLVGFCIF